MPIDTYYTTKVSTERLEAVAGTNKETFQTKLEDLLCRIEKQFEEPEMLSDGAFYNQSKMWCGDVDIKEGDKVIDSDGTTYIVKGVSAFESVITTHHLEIILTQPR